MPDEQQQETQEQKQPPAFDPAAFKTDLLGEFNKGLNNALKNFKKDLEKQHTDREKAVLEARKREEQEREAAAEEMQADEPEGEQPKKDGQVQVKLPKEFYAEKRRREQAEKRSNEMQETVQRIQDENREVREKAEREERYSQISVSLLPFPFITEAAREDAERGLREQVKRDDDGTLYGGEQVPLKQFTADYMKTHTHLLNPKEINSSGAKGNSNHSSKKIQMEDIKPGMSKEQQAAAWAEIASAHYSNT